MQTQNMVMCISAAWQCEEERKNYAARREKLMVTQASPLGECERVLAEVLHSLSEQLPNIDKHHKPGCVHISGCHTAMCML